MLNLSIKKKTVTLMSMRLSIDRVRGVMAKMHRKVIQEIMMVSHQIAQMHTMLSLHASKSKIRKEAKNSWDSSLLTFRKKAKKLLC